MNTRNLVLAATLMISGTIFSQDSVATQIDQPIVKLSYLDSIKARKSFIFSSLIMFKLTNEELSKEEI